MISVIVTAYKEEKTIGKAIDSILKNNLSNYEIIVIAPDEPTLNVAKEYSRKFKNIKLLKDPQKGKPLALNIAVSKAKGDILILTDGDVFVSEDSLKPLIEPFKNTNIGAVSGNPVSTDNKDNMMGYWAYLLTNVANDWRKNLLKKYQRFFCSGYLFAIRKKLFPKLPEELLSEDGFISYSVYKNNYLISYSPESKVYIKYPDNFNDWIIQKKRSAGGYNQIKKLTHEELRSFSKESFGVFYFFKYVSSPKEFLWLISLFFSRVYLWFLIYKDINLKNKSREEIWKRVESTK